MAMVVDGHLSQDELDAAQRLRVAERLGLDGPGWHEVLTAFCQDMLLSSRHSWTDVAQLETHVVERMMAEIQDPNLQHTVLELCVAVAELDGEVTESEAAMLDTAFDQWGLANGPGAAARA
jgi:tellurite resistance protein